MLPARTPPTPRTHWQKRLRVRRRASGRTVAYNIRFAGQVFDGQAGLHQNGFRDYDPASGRYVESDPIGALAGVDTYTYAESHPIVSVDPWGLADLNFFNRATDPDLWQLAQQWNPSDAYSVAGHGIVDEGLHSLDEIALPNQEGLNAKRLAERILKDKNWKKRPISIRGCSLGEGNNSFAQQLANILKVDVTAPTRPGSWDSLKLPFGLGTLDLGVSFPLGGGFKTFHPQN